MYGGWGNITTDGVACLLQGGEAKISDVGLSKMMHGGGGDDRADACFGTFAWAAPEVTTLGHELPCPGVMHDVLLFEGLVPRDMQCRSTTSTHGLPLPHGADADGRGALPGGRHLQLWRGVVGDLLPGGAAAGAAPRPHARRSPPGAKPPCPTAPPSEPPQILEECGLWLATMLRVVKPFEHPQQ